MPRRGALALVTTVLAVVLLFNFKPADPSTALAGGLPGGTLPTTAPEVGASAQPTPPTVAAGPPAPSQAASNGNGGTGSRGGSAATPAPQQQAQPTDPPGPPGTTASGTFTGAAIDTPYGTVQIALVVQNGTIVDVQELQMPRDRRLSAQISSEAGPMLRDQVIRAQSDQINGVSGASYTSYGFYESLQSALQKV